MRADPLSRSRSAGPGQYLLLPDVPESLRRALYGLRRFPADQVEWLTAPSVFASSNRAERGFCAVCGTPLTYRHIGAPYISVTLHSLDDPTTVRPDTVFSPGAAPDWCFALADLPKQQMDFAADPDFRNYQRPATRER